MLISKQWFLKKRRLAILDKMYRETIYWEKYGKRVKAGEKIGNVFITFRDEIFRIFQSFNISKKLLIYLINWKGITDIIFEYRGSKETKWYVEKASYLLSLAKKQENIWIDKKEGFPDDVQIICPLYLLKTADKPKEVERDLRKYI